MLTVRALSATETIGARIDGTFADNSLRRRLLERIYGQPSPCRRHSDPVYRNSHLDPSIPSWSNRNA